MPSGARVSGESTESVETACVLMLERIAILCEV